MILDPSTIAALHRVAEQTRFRKGHKRTFRGERLRGPGGCAFIARQIGVHRNTVMRMLSGRNIAPAHAERAEDFVAELRIESPELFTKPRQYEPMIGNYSRSQWITFAVEALGLTEGAAEKSFDYMYQQQRRQQLTAIAAHH